MKLIYLLLLLAFGGIASSALAQRLGGTLYGGGNLAQVRSDTPVIAAGDLLELSESSVQGALQLLPRLELGPVNIGGEFWFETVAAEHADLSGEVRIQRLIAEYAPGSEWLLSLGARLFHSGTAYVWNPSNPFTDPRANNLDRAFPFYREGDPFAAAEWLGAADGLTLQAVDWLPGDPLYGPDPDRESSIALRWEHVFTSADVAAVLARRDEENFFSLAGSMAIGEGLELHAEAALHDRRRTLLPLGSSLTLPGGGSAFSELVPTDEDGSVGQILIGGQYTFANLTNIILEYFYNQEGYSDAEFLSLRTAVAAAEQGTQDPNLGAANRGFLADVAGISGRMRRNYLFGRVAIPDLVRELDLNLFLRWGLDDDARVGGLLATMPLAEGLELRASAEHFSGSESSEASFIPYRWRGSLALSLKF